jgi:hypothetical protein
MEACPSCLEELQEFRRALGGARAAARNEWVKDWTEPEWKALMARIASEETGQSKAAAGFRPRWAMASGLAAVILLAVLTLVFRTSIFQPGEMSPTAGPEVVSVTMVSQETGLQVVWFFNKNFDWKGDKK